MSRISQSRYSGDNPIILLARTPDNVTARHAEELKLSRQAIIEMDRARLSRYRTSGLETTARARLMQFSVSHS